MRASTLSVLVACGLAVGSLAVAVSVWRAAGGHGSYLPAKVLLPFSMLTTAATEQLTIIGVVAVAQWALYGAIIGTVSERNRRNAVLAVVITHALAVLACFAFVSPENFP